MKKAVIALLAVAVVAATVTLWFSNPLDSLLKAAIEKFGSEMTAATVRVSKVHLSPTDGRGALSGLSLGNPKGFKTDHAFKAGHIEVALDPATLADDTILINKILIDAPSISYEKGDNGTNFDVIQRNVERYLGTAQKKNEKTEPGKKMVIESLVIRNAKVNYNGMIELSLPDIELHNIGKKRGGATSAEVVNAIVAELNAQIAIALAKTAAIGAVGGIAVGIGMGVKSLLGK
ncbi:MAG TPA: AsmA family protein [Gallionella sp.]|nr:AsmA family protein [Gallionella sp.]